LVPVLAATCAFSSSTVLTAQQPGPPSLDDTVAVFQIQASGCRQGPSRQQTGFVLAGVTGIYTALHGVVGCKTIDALRRQDALTFTGLKIEKVDIERDAALLLNTDLADAVNNGRIRGQRSEQLSELTGRALVVVGHASATPHAFTSTLWTDDIKKQILHVIPGGPQKTNLELRGSPLLTTRVLTHSGPLGPGHSGAPVLDRATDRVVAFGEGGLVGSQSITFSIPIEDIQFRPVEEVETSLFRVADQRVSGQFSFQSSDYRPEALRPSLTGAAGMAGGAVDFRFRLQAPLFTGRRRLNWTADLVFLGEQSTQLFQTLPGIPPSDLTETKRWLYVAPGVSYYMHSSPSGAFDPYFRIGALMSKATKFVFGGEVSVGSDIRVLGPIMLMVEASAMEVRVPTTTRSFNQYGDATVTEFTKGSTHLRLYLGSGATLPTW
jgi:hypothetical protein